MALGVLSGVSAVIGICVLTTASVVLDMLRPRLEYCNHKPTNRDVDFCIVIKYWIAASSFGIIAGFVETSSVLLACIDTWRVWSGAHLISFLMSMTAYCIGMTREIWLPHKINNEQIKIFLSFCSISMTFSLTVGCIGFYLNKLLYGNGNDNLLPSNVLPVKSE